MRAARLLRAQWHFATGDPTESLKQVDALLTDIGYPATRTANRLATILTLKARSELALGQTAAALSTAERAVSIAEEMSLDPNRSAWVGGALMALAESRRALGDSPGASASAERAAQVLTAALGPDHSETQTAMNFR